MPEQIARKGGAQGKAPCAAPPGKSGYAPAPCEEAAGAVNVEVVSMRTM